MEHLHWVSQCLLNKMQFEWKKKRLKSIQCVRAIAVNPMITSTQLVLVQDMELIGDSALLWAGKIIMIRPLLRQQTSSTGFLINV